MHPDDIYGWSMPVLWIAWLVYWLAPSARAKRTRRVESLGLAVSHWTPLLLGIALLSLPSMSWMGWLSQRILPRGEGVFWCGAALTVAGLGVTIWARRALGGNWSGVVTLKDDHTLIRNGPYRLVRHPIYTGLLIALLGSAVTRCEWRGFIGLALVAAAFLRKLAIEERWLAEQFPAEYARYRKEVPALVPRLLPR